MKWLDLRVGSHRVAVHLVKPTDPKLEDNLALYDHDNAAIYISSALEASVRNEKLFHELDHSVNEVSGANLSLRNAVKAPRKRGPGIDSACVELEEALVRARAAIWPRLLQDLGFVFPKGPAE
jgi:hypothetical protein